MIKSKQVQVVTTLGGVGWADVHSGKKEKSQQAWQTMTPKAPIQPYPTLCNPL